MWCLSEIFADNSDKARFITALVSVIAAVLVVYLTHAFASRRRRIELRAEKMEELYSAVSTFSELAFKVIQEEANPIENGQDSSGSYYEAHSKVEMIASIYFDDILKDVSDFHLITILSTDDGSEPILGFPEKIKKCAILQNKIQNAISNKVRKIV